MDTLENNIISLSNEYTNNTDKNHLKKFGQYFTLSTEILNKLLSDNQTFKQILEPSCGFGSIILECLKIDINCNIDAIELDQSIYNKTTELFTDYHNVNIINDNFLNHQFDKQYDLIIGNPPYFELPKNDRLFYSSNYNEIYNGRVNIYSLFIYKSINLLTNNGHFIFIIPKTILSSISFLKLREFIHKHCNIIDIIKFDNNKLFKKALQSVIILKLQKITNPNNNFKLTINNNLYFIKNFGNLFLNEQTTTISKLNCKVKTGCIVWNQHKPLLNNIKTDNNLQLIFSENIKQISNKKIFVTMTESNKQSIISGPFILVNRIVSNGVLNTFFQQSNNDDTKCFIENHVNFITGPLEHLTRIFNSLSNPKTITFLNEFISNTQVSQYELENIIPIFS